MDTKIKRGIIVPPLSSNDYCTAPQNTNLNRTNTIQWQYHHLPITIWKLDKANIIIPIPTEERQTDYVINDIVFGAVDVVKMQLWKPMCKNRTSPSLLPSTTYWEVHLHLSHVAIISSDHSNLQKDKENRKRYISCLIYLMINCVN